MKSAVRKYENKLGKHENKFLNKVSALQFKIFELTNKEKRVYILLKKQLKNS